MPFCPVLLPRRPLQTTDPEVEQLFGGAGIHAGYADVFTQLWPAVRNSLDERVVNAKGPVPSVVVTGHSLGAAVASLTAYAAQQYLDAERGSTAPTVDAVLFAPPQAGDAVFSELYGKLVNSRR